MRNSSSSTAAGSMNSSPSALRLFCSRSSSVMRSSAAAQPLDGRALVSSGTPSAQTL